MEVEEGKLLQLSGGFAVLVEPVDDDAEHGGQIVGWFEASSGQVSLGRLRISN